MGQFRKKVANKPLLPLPKPGPGHREPQKNLVGAARGSSRVRQ
ncbi:MAG: hypothetical protein AVDCRST_MAG56-354 [uncultured Cytophagales bacterium]|uniref:Uncharacterized protein n=1 Tax=uncultured Cytophagales bacterium TaxID=158755 RepID=A0A6J4H271_9SPHI|nr:MAG: hypothetical protein AVDCRST_MAG56-354 [uncultured Cytophagales bacterium]